VRAIATAAGAGNNRFGNALFCRRNTKALPVGGTFDIDPAVNARALWLQMCTRSPRPIPQEMRQALNSNEPRFSIRKFSRQILM
jgi:hypothetical protein